MRFVQSEHLDENKLFTSKHKISNNFAKSGSGNVSFPS